VGARSAWRGEGGQGWEAGEEGKVYEGRERGRMVKGEERDQRRRMDGGEFSS